VSESVSRRRKRGRPRRVNITYEVELGGAQVLKSCRRGRRDLRTIGSAQGRAAQVKDRKFVEIDRDNFVNVLKSMSRAVAIRVDNTLKGDGSELSVELNFEKLSDSSPRRSSAGRAAAQAARGARQLKDLQSRTEGKRPAEEMLGEIIATKRFATKMTDATGAGAAGLRGGGWKDG